MVVVGVVGRNCLEIGIGDREGLKKWRSGRELWRWPNGRWIRIRDGRKTGGERVGFKGFRYVRKKLV
jgi:hypothetical protein